MAYSAHRLLAQFISEMGVTFYSSDEHNADGGDDAEINISDAIIPEAFFTSILAHAAHSMARQSLETSSLSITGSSYRDLLAQALKLNPLGAKFHFDHLAMFGVKGSVPDIGDDPLSTFRILTIVSSAKRQLCLYENARIDLTERFISIADDTLLFEGLVIDEAPEEINQNSEQINLHHTSPLLESTMLVSDGKIR